MGLAGQLRTGCPNTPAYKSLYGNVHKPSMAQPHMSEALEDDGSQPMVDEIKSYAGPAQEPVGLITGKKSTRNSTFYQVRTLCGKGLIIHVHVCQ